MSLKINEEILLKQKLIWNEINFMLSKNCIEYIKLNCPIFCNSRSGNWSFYD